MTLTLRPPITTLAPTCVRSIPPSSSSLLSFAMSSSLAKVRRSDARGRFCLSGRLDLAPALLVDFDLPIAKETPLTSARWALLGTAVAKPFDARAFLASLAACMTLSASTSASTLPSSSRARDSASWLSALLRLEVVAPIPFG